MTEKEIQKMPDGARDALAQGWDLQDVKSILVERGLTEARAAREIAKMVRDLTNSGEL